MMNTKFMRTIRRFMSVKMSNLLITPNREGIFQAAELIKSGNLVAFPTETVYGLGANALNAEAVKSIFVAKGRPLTDPLIVHVAEKSQSYDLIDLSATELKIFDLIADKFWPGPLTLIVKASVKIPMLVTADTGFVGIRCPNHPLAVELLRASDLPIAAPSANRFGHVSPTTAAHVIADLGEKGVHVLNGEFSEESLQVDNSIKITPYQNCEFGIESSVVKVDSENQQLIIFRQGAISQIQLENTLSIYNKNMESNWKVISIQRAVKMHNTDSKSIQETEEEKLQQEVAAGQQAPGQAITHYAPDVPCYIIQSLTTTSTGFCLIGQQNNNKSATLAGTDSNQSTTTAENNELIITPEDCLKQCVVIDFAKQLQCLSTSSTTLAYKDLSECGSTGEAARKLFDTLRWAETIPNARKVFIASIPLSGPGESGSVVSGPEGSSSDMTLGLIDRIYRAASGVVVNLTIQ